MNSSRKLTIAICIVAIVFAACDFETPVTVETNRVHLTTASVEKYRTDAHDIMIGLMYAYIDDGLIIDYSVTTATELDADSAPSLTNVSFINEEAEASLLADFESAVRAEFGDFTYEALLEYESRAKPMALFLMDTQWLDATYSLQMVTHQYTRIWPSWHTEKMSWTSANTVPRVRLRLNEEYKHWSNWLPQSASKDDTNTSSRSFTSPWLANYYYMSKWGLMSGSVSFYSETWGHLATHTYNGPGHN